MTTDADLQSGDKHWRSGSPIVGQYAAIRARQRQIAAIAGVLPRKAPEAATARSDHAIWVRRAKTLWYLSSLDNPEIVLLNPQPEAAMRFGTPGAASALIEQVAALREMAALEVAGIAELGAPEAIERAAGTARVAPQAWLD